MQKGWCKRNACLGVRWREVRVDAPFEEKKLLRSKKHGRALFFVFRVAVAPPVVVVL
jgi:hypothetical protein